MQEVSIELVETGWAGVAGDSSWDVAQLAECLPSRSEAGYVAHTCHPALRIGKQMALVLASLSN